MEFLPEIFSKSDAAIQVTNVFAFSMDEVFLAAEATSEEEELVGSVLLRIDLTGTKPTYQVLHEFNLLSLDYLAESPTLHYVLASGAFIHRIENGAMTLHTFAARAFLNRLAQIEQGQVAVFGENGLVFRFDGNEYRQIPTSTNESLHAMHFPRADFAYAGGDYGTLLRGDGTRFSAVELGSSPFIKALHVKRDGAVMLGCGDGIGLVVTEDEVVSVEGPGADIYSVTEFQGSEYWGDDEFGVYVRHGTELVPRFETGYAFNLNTHGSVLTINAGIDVYLYDGGHWVRLTVNTDVDNFIERVPLDFTPL